jgi:hypothetical protein
MITRLFSILLPALTTMLLSSCGTGFQKEWEQASASSKSIEGRWEGSWLSGANGHTGKLRCVVGPEQTGDTREFHYFATWGKVFRGSFNAVHEVTEKSGVTAFKAKHDIGTRGTFHAEGTITPNEFHATYRAAGDHGTFVMKRPQ